MTDLDETIIRRTPRLRRYFKHSETSDKDTVRAYRDTPETVALQLRMETSYAIANLRKGEALQLAKALTKYANEISRD